MAEPLRRAAPAASCSSEALAGAARHAGRGRHRPAGGDCRRAAAGLRCGALREQPLGQAGDEHHAKRSAARWCGLPTNTRPVAPVRWLDVEQAQPLEPDVAGLAQGDRSHVAERRQLRQHAQHARRPARSTFGTQRVQARQPSRPRDRSRGQLADVSIERQGGSHCCAWRLSRSRSIAESAATPGSSATSASSLRAYSASRPVEAGDATDRGSESASHRPAAAPIATAFAASPPQSARPGPVGPLVPRTGQGLLSPSSSSRAPVPTPDGAPRLRLA